MMNYLRRIVVILGIAAALSSCENAWMIFPKYPAPYRHPYHKKVREAEVEINHVTVRTYLRQIRGSSDYQSTSPILIGVSCQTSDQKGMTGVVRLKEISIEIDGTSRYTQRFENVVLGFDGLSKSREGVYCSAKDGEVKFSTSELLPPETYRKGQELTIHVTVAVTHQGVTKRGKVSSQYVGATKSGIMRQAYWP